MIIIFKKILNYILFLLPWFLSTLLVRDFSYYKELNKPFFAPPTWVFPIVWTILFILMAYSIYKTFNKRNKEYLIALIVNYISNQLYTIFFFLLKNNFLAFVDTLIVLISSLYLYYETKEIDNKESKFIIPYTIWNAFATLLSLTIFLMN